MSSRQIKIINKISQQLGWVQWGGGVCWGTPSKDGRFFNTGGSNFILKEVTKFGPFSQIFQRCFFFSKKINPSHFIFQRVLQKFEDSDSICLWGMQIKMECPGHTKTFKAVSHTFLFLVKPSQSSFHQKDGNSFFWHQKEDWKIHHQPYEPLKSAKNMIGRKKIYFSK